MPKCKPLGSAEMKALVTANHSAQKRAKIEDQRIRDQLDILKVHAHVTHAQLAKMLGMSVETWKYRREHPASFKLDEQRTVQELAKIYNMEVTFA